MAVKEGNTRLYVTVPVEHADYLRARYRDMYSDARNPGDVLAFLLAQVIRADQDPHGGHRVTDRIRFSQQRIGSATHARNVLLLREIDHLCQTYRRVESQAEFGWRQRIDEAKAAVKEAMGNGTWNSNRRRYIIGGGPDPVFNPERFPDDSLGSGEVMRKVGAFAADQRLSGLLQGLHAALDDPSVMMASDALDPYPRPNAMTWAPATATVPLLKRIEIALREEPGADLRWLHTPGSGRVHDEALASALSYLESRGLIGELPNSPGRYRWGTRPFVG